MVYDPAAVRAGANAQIMQMLSEVIAARRDEPKDDLVSALIGEPVQGKHIGAPFLQVPSWCAQLF